MNPLPTSKILGGPESLLSLDRLANVYVAAVRGAELGPGAEVGVYKGGSARVIAEAYRDSGFVVDLFDTFEGLPAPGSLDKHAKGEFSADEQAVRSLFKEFPKVRIFKGVFPWSIPAIAIACYGFVHIDVDLYRSTLDVLVFFYPRLAKGAIMILDDLGAPTCPGARLAADEFFRDKPETPILTFNPQHYIVKV